MEDFAVNELQSYGIPVDDSLLSYCGRPIRVSNGIIAFLKQHFGVKQSFSVFRRLIGVILDDDYRGEAVDRDVFRRKVRLIQEKFEKLNRNKNDSNAYLAEEFVHDFQFMDKAVKEADKRKSIKIERPNILAVTKSPSNKSEPISGLVLYDQETVVGATSMPSATAPPRKRRGKKRTSLERRPKSCLRRERLMKSRQLAQKKLQAAVSEGKLSSVSTSNLDLGKFDSDTKLAVIDAVPDEDEAPLKIVEQDEIPAPASTSGSSEDAQKSLRAALRREKFAKKRIQVLSYRLRDEKLSLQEALRKLKQLEKDRIINSELRVDSQTVDWKEKANVAFREVESLRLELAKLRKANCVLAERCYQFQSDEVALKPNGKFLEDLRPCIKHLVNIGVPPEKCGEVLVVVGTLFGKKIVAEKSVVSERIPEGAVVKSL